MRLFSTFWIASWTDARRKTIFSKYPGRCQSYRYLPPSSPDCHRYLSLKSYYVVFFSYTPLMHYLDAECKLIIDVNPAFTSLQTPMSTQRIILVFQSKTGSEQVGPVPTAELISTWDSIEDRSSRPHQNWHVLNKFFIFISYLQGPKPRSTVGLCFGIQVIMWSSR
jgi:hypothetical protein